MDYFDIKKLFKVMQARGWTEGKNFMKFWADGSARVAAVDEAKGKSTIGANIGRGLRVYTIRWNWLDQYSSAKTQYQRFFNERVKNPAVSRLLKVKYGAQSRSDLITPFNDWLTNGLPPSQYQKYIKNHQLQYIHVNPYDMNGGKFNDLVAALNGFNFFAFYKGLVISGPVFRKGGEKKSDKKKAPGVSGGGSGQQNDLEAIPARDRKTIESHLQSPRTKNVVYVTHVGVYAGDIYEFNGKQYLATWNLKKNTVTLSTWDYLWGTSDTDDKEDLAITNETYRIYREKTGKGGDFLALSPVKLVAYPFILPVQ